jgi:chitinase
MDMRPRHVTLIAAAPTTTAPTTASPSVSRSPSSSPSTPTGPLPRHFLTGYWQDFVNPATPLRLRDVPNEYDLVAVAFATATASPGGLAFGVDPGLSAALGGYTDADFKADVATLHSRGKKVILSVGGETGTVNFITALACIQLENGLRPDQVALGLPAGPGAAGGGVVAPSAVNQALDCLARGTNCGTFKPPRTYPGIRGAMTWSINWDVKNGNGFARTVGPHLATLP